MNDEDFVFQAFMAQVTRRENARQSDRAGALNVVVEGWAAVSVSLEHGERSGLRKVLPLDHRIGPTRPDSVDELVQELVVVVSPEPLLTNAQVVRVIDQVHAIRANVERHGHRVERADAPTDGVERHLTNWNREAAVSLVANAEDGRRVRGDDHTNVFHRVTVERLIGAIDVEWRKGEATRVLIEGAELLNRGADRRRVDDG
jgi:hypothetical protein